MISGKTTGCNGLRVVVIGDEEAYTSELVSVLKREGVETMTLGRQECIDCLSHNSPSVVIVVAGRGSEGWQISSHIRRQSNVPIIVADADGDRGDWVKAAEYGVDYYLKKPVSSRELVARVKALARRRRPWSSAEVGDINKVTKL